MSPIYQFDVRIVDADGARCDQPVSINVNPPAGPSWANANTTSDVPPTFAVLSGLGGHGNEFDGSFTSHNPGDAYIECNFTAVFTQPWNISIAFQITGNATVIIGGQSSVSISRRIDLGIPATQTIYDAGAPGDFALSPKIGTWVIGVLGVGPHSIIIRGSTHTDFTAGNTCSGTWHAVINAT